ncbi:hypothetical protein [Terrisporobacter sp.]|uniref:hypothetical protein n=1 Tax=Terrisporobacter sp. TaxID=1965305 RepID=UPI0026360D35|nr:hypothetical protein [Terrisporobacter sp.]
MLSLIIGMSIVIAILFILICNIAHFIGVNIDKFRWLVEILKKNTINILILILQSFIIVITFIIYHEFIKKYDSRGILLIVTVFVLGLGINYLTKLYLNKIKLKYKYEQSDLIINKNTMAFS